ncbi:hypothetical protein [Nitrosomonas sp. Nm33]|uniref:hypothetical protein n=1 Tax=Nitrosomonas sp. Nm33 TaxID=133724 RepID=UPI00089582D7|nr:hypothetical protein [Nitrosomonas sp. Nm33]SDX98217.1 hypothetical protein SAMN05421755_100414 [Nitrosomonas sp. Nm33]
MTIALVGLVSAAPVWTADRENADFDGGDFGGDFDGVGDSGSDYGGSDFDAGGDFWSDFGGNDFRGDFDQNEDFADNFEQPNDSAVDNDARYDLGSAQSEGFSQEKTLIQDNQSTEFDQPPKEGELVQGDFQDDLYAGAAKTDESAQVDQASQDGKFTQPAQSPQSDESTQTSQPGQETGATQDDQLTQNDESAPVNQAANGDGSTQNDQPTQRGESTQSELLTQKGDTTQIVQPTQEGESVQVDQSIQTNVVATGDSLTQNINIQNVQSVQNDGFSHGIWHGHHHEHHHHHDFDIGFGLGVGLGLGLDPFYSFTPFSGFGYYGYDGFAPYSGFGFYRGFDSFGGIGFYSSYVPFGYVGSGPYSHFGYYPLGGFPAVVAAPVLPITMISALPGKSTYMQQQNVPQSAPEPKTNYWHYCRNPEGYYPYVRKCPDGWVKIPPEPS